MIKAESYPGMSAADGKVAPYRWLLRASDTRSLYRQFNRMEGIKVTEAAHLNIHEWLDPLSPQYNDTLAKAIFHYSARATKEDRFEVCVSTDEMKTATWKYAHKSQIILDGTFGVCDKKVLLFIVMGLDEERKGVPLAFLFFSAPSGNRHSAAGYNTEILAKLLETWKKSLGERDGKPFEAWVAITDTDLKERGALLCVFPRIWLLICKFHLRQSWRNHRNKLLKGKTQIHIDVKNRLRRVETQLVETTRIEDARTIIQKETEALEAQRSNGDPVEASVAKKGIAHLQEYLLCNWVTDAMWRSWSNYGRQVAAQILGCSFDGVLPTTNHLESFNGLLKRKHLRRWQNGGRRLRVDVLLKLLVTKVLPSIFEQRAMEQEDRKMRENQIRSIPGGLALLARPREPQLPTPAHLTPDPTRDVSASVLVQNKQISTPTFTDSGLTFTCYSSLALEHEPSPVIYNIYLGFDGTGKCDCLDFAQRGGACKHMRAALLHMNDLRTRGVPVPDICLPSPPTQVQRCIPQSIFDPSLVHRVLIPAVMAKAATAVEDVLRETEDVYQADERGGDGNEDSGDDESVPTETEEEDKIKTAPVKPVCVIGHALSIGDR